MKIGIDARMYGVAGPGRYLSNLIKELEKIDTENDYVVFVTKEGSDKYHPKNPRFKKWIADYSLYSVQEQTSFLITLVRARLDLLHVPHFNIPIFYPKKMVVTVHDLTMHEFGSRNTTTLPPIQFVVKRFGYKMVTAIAVFRAKRIIVPSKIIKEELKERFKFVNDEKILVTYEGVDNRLLEYSSKDRRVVKTRLEEMKIKDEYFLYVGSAYPHKNLKTLIVSYKELLRSSKFDGQFVIAGRIDKFSEGTAGFVHALKLDRKIIFAARYSESEYMPDKDLAYLYQGALAYVSPSLSEGFSITPLEAQAFGIPVLLSDILTHREVFGRSALYFDPKSTIDLSEKMHKIANDKTLRRALVEAGYKNVKKYSWEKMAEETLQVYIDSDK